MCEDHWTQATALILSALSFLGLLFQPCPVGKQHLFSKPNNHSISVCRELIGPFIGGLLTDHLDFQTSAVVSKTYIHKNLCMHYAMHIV